MKQLGILLVMLLCARDALAACKVVTDDSIPKDAVCAKRGSVTKAFARRNLNRRFYAPNFETCNRYCLQDLFCDAIGYDSTSGKCESYFQRIPNAFTPSKKSSVLFTEKTCYDRTGFCGFINAGFEDSPTSGNGSVRLFPTNFKDGSEQVFLAPWGYNVFGDSRQLLFSIVTPSAQTPNLPAAPEGKSYILNGVGVGPSADVESVQRVNLAPNTQYRLTFKYAWLEFTAPAGYSDTEFTVVGIYDQNLLQGQAVVLNAANGDVDQTFKTAVFTFTTGDDAADKQLGVRIRTPGTPAPSASAQFLFDAFTLRPVHMTE